MIRPQLYISLLAATTLIAVTERTSKLLSLWTGAPVYTAEETKISPEIWGKVGTGGPVAVFVSGAATGSDQSNRLIYHIDRNPAEVVTAYRTSKVAKYWRDQS